MNVPPNPFTLVIPGASGDLTRRKLIPALFRLFQQKHLPENFNIVGVSRTPMSDEKWEKHLKEFISGKKTPEKSEAAENSRAAEKSESAGKSGAAGISEAAGKSGAAGKSEAAENSGATGKSESAAHSDSSENSWDEFRTHLLYFTGDASQRETFSRLESFLKFVENGEATPRIFYLATAPALYHPILEAIAPGVETLEKEGIPTRIVVEKPFGSDLESAVRLNIALHGIFREEQIFRIDHYLGKETVQNLMALRFANSMFEPLWNRHFIHDVQITAGEDSLVGKRSAYYNQTGILRDMFQNHLLQLLCLTAMEPPASLAPEDVRNEKVKVLQCIRPFETPHDVERRTIRGQYRIPNLARKSEFTLGLTEPVLETELEMTLKAAQEPVLEPQTATFAAVRLEIENWRWLGVPFYLRSGKGMSCRTTQIILRFREAPHLLFPRNLWEKREIFPHDADKTGKISKTEEMCVTEKAWKTCEKEGISGNSGRNVLLFQIQPAEGIQLYFEAKVPDAEWKLSQAAMHFTFAQSFPGRIPDAYERLLLDVLHGDSGLFTRNDEVETAWRLFDPVQNAWDAAAQSGIYPHPYEIGSWGPTESGTWMKNFGGEWFDLCPVLSVPEQDVKQP